MRFKSINDENSLAMEIPKERAGRKNHDLGINLICKKHEDQCHWSIVKAEENVKGEAEKHKDLSMIPKLFS